MRKVYEAPAIETVTFAQEAVLAPSAADATMTDPNVVLGTGTTGTTTKDTDALTGVEMW